MNGEIGNNNLSDSITNRNLDLPERIFSAAIGGALLYSSFAKPSRLVGLGLGAFLIYRAATGDCAFYRFLGKHAILYPRNVNIRCSIIVNRARPEVYAFWRKLANLPRFMKHLVRVEENDLIRSSWEASIPGVPGSIKWQAMIVKEQENELIGWESLPNNDIVNAGKVEFLDAGNRATEVRIVVSYRAPVGIAGEKIARWLNPSFEKMVFEDLKRFKEVIEHGESVLVG